MARGMVQHVERNASGPVAAGEDPAPRVVIIGAGPAGLTAAYELVSANLRPTVLEADGMVGGISRTVVRDG
jgi:phytoene dehydrogenase-like protein